MSHGKPLAPREEFFSRSETPACTGLLVSVRSAAEAETAFIGGADLIDVKEPSRGPLGAADPATWAEIHRAIAGRAPTSVALGELLDERIETLAAECGGFQFAKIGLAACQERGWVDRWRRVVQSLPVGTLPVPVAYADWRAAGAPSPRVALTIAECSLSRLMLIDTFDKSRGTLLCHLDQDYLADLAREAKSSGVRLVLAGSLGRESIPSLLELKPRYLGVRGAACSGGRDGTIDLSRVKTLARLVRSGRKIRPR